ncbi:hypothetical protein P280DRAFT_75882 [Massarina eburnea CBS 473.64]|uniref:Uncharacterized protein n=1 Tax=Massarina eburnea CBS 473.64 TaxID=1395130 RepID=A0A6A6RU52_9PLEO|nr:hypothetical protein P280DRAFT_75882 [Massarina eburnea CBS 473.64]
MIFHLTNIVGVLSVLLIALIFQRISKHHKTTQRLTARLDADATILSALWQTDEWKVLHGLFDVFLTGSLPISPLNERCETSLRSWPEKRYLRRLVHMGILPLFIQNGGTSTRLDGPTEGYWGTRWLQGKKRACFEFVVPMAEGYSLTHMEKSALPNFRERRPWQMFVENLLDNKHGFRVCVSNEYGNALGDVSNPAPDHSQPLEIGATSCFEPLLPFKKDEVLQYGKGDVGRKFAYYVGEGKDAPGLLVAKRNPVVRVECPHFEKKKLDTWVYGMAVQAGVQQVWEEADLGDYTRAWSVQNSYQTLPAYFLGG